MRAKASIVAGFAALTSPGGLGVAYALALSAGGFVTPALRLAASAVVSLNALDHEGREGTSRSRVYLLGAELRGEFRREARLRPSLGAGIDLAVLASQGRDAAPDYTDASARRLGSGGHVNLGLSYHLTPSLSLRLSASVGALLARYALGYGGRAAAHWGVPWFMGEFGLEWRIL